MQVEMYLAWGQTQERVEQTPDQFRHTHTCGRWLPKETDAPITSCSWLWLKVEGLKGRVHLYVGLQAHEEHVWI